MRVKVEIFNYKGIFKAESGYCPTDGANDCFDEFCLNSITHCEIINAAKFPQITIGNKSDKYALYLKQNIEGQIVTGIVMGCKISAEGTMILSEKLTVI